MEKDVLESMSPAQRTSYEVSRRKALGIAAKLGLGGAAAAAMTAGVGSRSVRQAMAAGGLPQKPYKITFVNHVTTNPFFTPTIYGIEDACAFLGCSYQWTGSQNSTVTEMVSAMQTAIADKVDGIAVCLVDAEAFNKPTDRCAQHRHPGDRVQRRYDPQCSARLRRPEPLPIRLQHRPEVAADGEGGRQSDALDRDARFAEPAAATRRLHPGDQGRRRHGHL